MVTVYTPDAATANDVTLGSFVVADDPTVLPFASVT